MRVFIGGIMQGSNHPNVMSDQGYRRGIAQALAERWPEVEVVDPLTLHPDGLGYDTEAARRTLLAMAALAAECDLVIAYVPTASMGTALEMNAAYHAGIPVVAVSPMHHNWVLRAFASRIYPDLDGLYTAIRSVSGPLELTTYDGAAP